MLRATQASIRALAFPHSTAPRLHRAQITPTKATHRRARNAFAYAAYPPAHQQRAVRAAFPFPHQRRLLRIPSSPKLRLHQRAIQKQDSRANRSRVLQTVKKPMSEPQPVRTSIVPSGAYGGRANKICQESVYCPRRIRGSKWKPHCGRPPWYYKDLLSSDLWLGKSCGRTNVLLQQTSESGRAASGCRLSLPRSGVEAALRPRLWTSSGGTRKDLPNSNLWFGRSCGRTNVLLQQTSESGRAASGTGTAGKTRVLWRLARVQFMLGQVVWPL